MTRSKVRCAVLASAVLLLSSIGGCGRRTPAPASGSAGGAASGARKPTGGGGDALFLAEAPAVVPEALEPDLAAMKIDTLYVAGASLDETGRVTALPPPPERLKRPVVFVVMASRAQDQLAGGRSKEVAEAWGPAIGRAVAAAKPWGSIAGVHLHLWPKPEQADALATVLKRIKKECGGLPVSVTLSPEPPPKTWKPLAGAADEALILCFGRRPETGDQMAPEMSEEAAHDFPLPFRLLLVPGGYGFPGGADRRIPDGEVDRLSETRSLDFDFGAVLSTEPGNSYEFRPRPGEDPAANPLRAEGGKARFQVLTMSEMVRFLAGAKKWRDTPMRGRVFMLNGVPEDGHLLGFPAIRALLTGAPVDPQLEVNISPGAVGRGWAEFSIAVTNRGPAPSELTHDDNWVQVRVEGGVLSAGREGDFDRYTLRTSAEQDSRLTDFAHGAVVCRLHENIFAAGETSVAGPFKATGNSPRVFLSYQVSVPGGQLAAGPEVMKELRTWAPPTPAAKGKTRPQLR